MSCDCEYIYIYIYLDIQSTIFFYIFLSFSSYYITPSTKLITYILYLLSHSSGIHYLTNIFHICECHSLVWSPPYLPLRLMATSAFHFPLIYPKRQPLIHIASSPHFSFLLSFFFFLFFLVHYSFGVQDIPIHSFSLLISHYKAFL